MFFSSFYTPGSRSAFEIRIRIHITVCNNNTNFVPTFNMVYFPNVFRAVGTQWKNNLCYRVIYCTFGWLTKSGGMILWTLLNDLRTVGKQICKAPMYFCTFFRKLGKKPNFQYEFISKFFSGLLCFIRDFFGFICFKL